MSSNNLESWVLAPDRTTNRGIPFSSVNIERFVPIFSPIRRVFPHGFQCQRCFYHTAIYALPFPANALKFIIIHQGYYPHQFKESRALPLLKCLMDSTSAPILLWHCLPLTACSQNVKYPFQYSVRIGSRQSRSGGAIVFFVWISFRFWYVPFYLFPQFV